ncbi:class F sortase [Jatrophihabitans sp.]|uniref:class F sortase n=1 Tax=Jatrophihabitans sp. TaxID=1932789 RepID=UPI0030C77983
MLLAIGGVLAWAGTRGSQQPVAAPLPSVTSPSSAAPSAATSSPQSHGAQISASSRPQPHGAPVRANEISLPSLGVTATIKTAAVVHGLLDPPRVPDEVGIWTGSAGLTASSGTVLITGHVNWAGLPPFAFGRLADLRVGSRILTADASGEVQRWRVTTVLVRPKSEKVDTRIFAGAAGPRTLALVTCGGSYDAASKGYVDNIYVYATPE